MFKVDTAYKNRNMLEVAFEVHKVTVNEEAQVYELNVGWWTLKTFQYPMPMGINQTIKVRFDAVEYYNEIDLETYRKNADMLNKGEISL